MKAVRQCDTIKAKQESEEKRHADLQYYGREHRRHRHGQNAAPGGGQLRGMAREIYLRGERPHHRDGPRRPDLPRHPVYPPASAHAADFE